MDDHHFDRPAVAVRACAEQLLAGLIAAGDDPRAVYAVLSAGGWRVRVEVSPAPPEELVAGLNDCGRAVLALLWDAEGPLSAEKIRHQLEAKGAVFGLITVQRALRELHRTHGTIEHSRHRPRGYYLPQRLPLFRVQPRRDDADDNELDN